MTAASTTIQTTEEYHKDSFIKKKVDHIKEINEKLNLASEDTENLISLDILSICDFLEQKYKADDMDILIDQICVTTIEILRGYNLGKHISLAYAVIPDKFKNEKKNGFKNLQHEIAYNRIQKSLEELRKVDLSLLQNDALKEYYDESTKLTDKINEAMAVKGIPTHGQENNNNQWIDDDKNKFPPAEFGAPLYHSDELSKQDPEYAVQFELLDKTLRQSIHTWETIHKWFIIQYVPKDAESCKRLIWAFNNWNEFWKPFVDRKYRRNHYQLLKIAARKVIDTSTKASKESRIPCGHHFDKEGNPLFRRMTKEQIDAMYDSELNFMFEMFNTQFESMRIISEEDEQHGGRCREDRAIDLHATLEHHA